MPASLSDNEMLQKIYHRRSVRSFTSQPIPEDVFHAILEAGRLAPCGVNLQSWTFLVYDQSLWRKTFERMLPFRGSKAVIVISDTHRYRQVIEDFPYSPLTEYTIAVVNASLAAMTMNLAAEAVGVSSVMLSDTGQSGLLDAKYLQEKLKLPEGAVPLMTLVFGYAKGIYPIMPPKLPLQEVAFEGQYQSTSQKANLAWLEQTESGYNFSHRGTNFQEQLDHYGKKIGQAEHDLREMVFYKENQQKPSV
ncbi:MAG: nitroreductase family protein [Anaerolineaceae bacterium]